MQRKLKPCAHCGGEAKINWSDDCGCANESCGCPTGGYSFVDWNTRTPDPIIAELKEALELNYVTLLAVQAGVTGMLKKDIATVIKKNQTTLDKLKESE